MASTSIHSMNADKFLRKRTSRLYRRAWTASYYLLNRLNNALPDANVDPALRQDYFHLSDIRAEVEALNMPKASPSRILGDLFWKHLNWEQMQEALGGIRIGDFGCGNGRYGELFYEFSEQRVEQYHGYDLFHNSQWETLQQRYPFMAFQLFDSSQQRIVDVLDSQTNVITTQSAIEHFDDDLTFFEHLRDFIQQHHQPTLQIHLFPSAVCLDLYRLHGVRQYTPRTISAVTRLFSNFSDSVLYAIGNQASNQHHLETITYPVYDQGTDYRETHTDAYYQQTLDVLEEDMNTPSSQAGFYALVIYSYPVQKFDYVRMS